MITPCPKFRQAISFKKNMARLRQAILYGKIYIIKAFRPWHITHFAFI